MSELVVYTLAQCDTCRRATRWLREQNIPFVERPIRITPPSPAEIRAVLAALKGERRRLFNVSGQEYRAQKVADRLPKMSDGEAVALLASNGSLVKRPFVIGGGIGLTGFDEPTWCAALAGPNKEMRSGRRHGKISSGPPPKAG